MSWFRSVLFSILDFMLDSRLDYIFDVKLVLKRCLKEYLFFLFSFVLCFFFQSLGLLSLLNPKVLDLEGL